VLQRALELTFLSTTELFGSPLNCSMSSGMNYCSAFKSDEAFGAITDAFSYRWTGSCLANPEYEPEDMLKAILHALASSESQDTPFLVVLILPVWEDTPWNSAAIRGHHNMSTLIRIPAGHMRFVPSHRQSDEATQALSPAKWPVEFVLIANSKGREAFLSHDRISQILSPAIQATCALSPEHTEFFPSIPLSRGKFKGRLTPTPRRSLPAQPATPPRPTNVADPLRGYTQPDTPQPHSVDHHQLAYPPDTPSGAGAPSPMPKTQRGGGGYTSTQPLPELQNTAGFPPSRPGEITPYLDSPPVPYPWQPKYQPDQWVYTDGSDIDGHPRLGAAVVHVPTATTIYIDAAGTEETRTIMRAELVAIYVALRTFETHEWIGIFTDSLSSLQAIQQHHTNPGITGAKHYHHHSILLRGITDLLEERRRRGLRTTLHKLRGHTNIRGNDLADAAAKMAVTNFDTLPPSQTLRENLGEIAPRPQHWVMYTAKPPPPSTATAVGPRHATLRRPWWTIPDAERLQMHAFTRPSPQLRHKVRGALLRSLHQSSIYRRLILSSKENGARTHTVGRALHKKLTYHSWEGTSLLKFVYGQLYNGKLAKRYGHAPTDECPLCHKPDSCTHIAGECQAHDALRISRHNAACQLIHAAIRKAAKGGGALHSAPDLTLVMADTGTQPTTTEADIKSLSLNPEERNLPREAEACPQDWLAPLPTPNEISARRRTDVSQDPRYIQWGLTASTCDEECIQAPRRLPDWVLPQEVTQSLFEAGHGTAPDLIYARGVPDSPHPDPSAFDRKQCTLIIIEIGFCRDFGCVEKLEEKTSKYAPLLAALRTYWGRVELIAFPIGHAGTTLTRTLEQLTTAFSAVRPYTGRPSTSSSSTLLAMDHNAKAHDYTLFKSLLDSITDLAQSRLLGIIRNRKRLVDTLSGGVSHHRAHSAASPAHHQATPQQEAATHIHRTRTTRAPESTAIT
jgi:ribonuclease HI